MGCHVAENQLVPAIELESMVAQGSNPAEGVMRPGEKDLGAGSISVTSDF